MLGMLSNVAMRFWSTVIHDADGASTVIVLAAAIAAAVAARTWACWAAVRIAATTKSAQCCRAERRRALASLCKQKREERGPYSTLNVQTFR